MSWFQIPASSKREVSERCNSPTLVSESLVGVELSCVQLSFVFSCSRLDAEFRAVSFILGWFS